MLETLLVLIPDLLKRKLERAKKKGKGLKALRAICSDKVKNAVRTILMVYEDVCEFIEDLYDEPDDSVSEKLKSVNKDIV